MLLGSFIIGAFSLYIYHTTYDNIRGKLVDERYSYLQQTEGNLEQKIRTIEYAFSTYSTTKSFRDITSRPLDYTDYLDVKNVGTELRYIGTMGDDDTVYSLVSLKHNWKISNGALYQLSATEKSQLLKQVDGQDAPLFWRTDDNGIQMMVTLPFFEAERTSVGTAQLSNNTIKSVLTDGKISQFGILSKKGGVLFQNKSFLSKNVKQKIVKLAAAGKTQHYTDHQGNIFIFAQSDYNNWLYVTSIDHNLIRQQISTLALGLIVISLIIILLLYVMAYLIAAHSAKPIREIRDRLEVDPAQPHLNRPENPKINKDFRDIMGGIDRIVNENEILTRTIDYQKPELENLFVLNLYRHYVSADEIPKRLTQFGYPDLSTAFFITVLIQIDDYGTHQFEANDLLLMAIENVISTLIPADRRLKPVLVNKDTQATTFIFASEDVAKKQILTDCNLIQEMVTKYLKIKISFGISNVYQGLINSKESVDNAKEALRFRLNLGEEAIIFYDEIANKLDQATLVKNPKNRSQMLDAIRSGDKDALETLFPEVIREIFHENTNPISIKTSLLRLVGDIIQLGQLLGVKFDLTHDVRNIYYNVILIDNPTQLNDLLYKTLVDPIVHNTADKTSGDLQSLSEKMTQIVHTQYDQNISLDSIAEELHYNANYLSSVFKKEFGTNFSDYLQNYRIEIAKKWLIETDMTVKEMAEKLCYNNPQNFIRFFKKREKITPGAYRRRYKND